MLTWLCLKHILSAVSGICTRMRIVTLRDDVRRGDYALCLNHQHACAVWGIRVKLECTTRAAAHVRQTTVDKHLCTVQYG